MPTRSRHGRPRRQRQCVRSCFLLSPLPPHAIDAATSVMRLIDSELLQRLTLDARHMPATSQLDRLISMTAINVLAGSRAMRDRLKSFNVCMGSSIGSQLNDGCNIHAAAHGIFHHGIRRRGGAIFWSALPADERQVQADMRTHLIHRPARDIIPPLGGARVTPCAYCYGVMLR